ncbi:MAG TPA: flagellar biosynthetic protein FliR [Polyangia bacterium]|nr:flagellar biosynthetic protein FliR [Polyangia bacterium]
MRSAALLATALALGGARAAPLVWMVGPLGGVRLPAPARIGLSMLLAGLAGPLLLTSAGAAGLADAPTARLALLLSRELLVGLVLGLVASAAFRAAEVAGHLGDTLRGANLAEVLDPTSGERGSPLAVLYVLIATLVFFQIGGVPRLVEALLASYRVLPIGGGLGIASTRGAATLVTVASARVIASGIGLAAPVLVALWLADLSLGLIARAVPQLPVYFLGLPLKGLLAIGLVLVGLGALQAALAGDLAGWVSLLGRAASRL